MCKVGILAVVYWTEPKGVELGTLNIAKYNNSLIRYQAYYLPIIANHQKKFLDFEFKKIKNMFNG